MLQWSLKEFDSWLKKCPENKEGLNILNLETAKSLEIIKGHKIYHFHLTIKQHHMWEYGKIYLKYGWIICFYYSFDLTTRFLESFTHFWKYNLNNWSRSKFKSVQIHLTYNSYRSHSTCSIILMWYCDALCVNMNSLSTPNTNFSSQGFTREYSQRSKLSRGKESGLQIYRI